MCISHVCAHARAPARARARARGLFAVKGEGGVPYPLSLWNLSKENSIPTYQRYVGMLKLRTGPDWGIPDSGLGTPDWGLRGKNSGPDRTGLAKFWTPVLSPDFSPIPLRS